MDFFIPLKKIPTVTHQEKRVTVVNGKPRFYDSESITAARGMFTAYLAQHKPDDPMAGPIRLMTKWQFEGDPGWKTTKPDTDNMIKLFKDCMTKCGYWKDDAQVCSEITEKFYGPVEGIYVRVEALEND